MANKSNWKGAERDIAKAFGTERVLRQGTDSPDVRIPGFALEIKKSKAFPAWLWNFITQAKSNTRSGEDWAVILVEARRGVKTRRAVVIDFDRFVQLVADNHRYYRGESSEQATAVERIADTELENAIEALEDAEE